MPRVTEVLVYLKPHKLKKIKIKKGKIFLESAAVCAKAMAKNEARGSLAFMSKSPRHFPVLLSSVSRD